ncbi:hypothetical protein HBH99_196890 [Parastagonospora nodorum]|nr:hypothetical protein HBH99_196890 [Parastagonospora nodorum]
MSYALAVSYLFILLITLTLSKALNITILLTYLKSALSFSSCYAVLCVSIIKPLPMQHIETMLILILSLFNDAEVLLPANTNAGVMLRNKSNKYKGLVNKDLKLLKQKISAGY